MDYTTIHHVTRYLERLSSEGVFLKTLRLKGKLKPLSGTYLFVDNIEKAPTPVEVVYREAVRNMVDAEITRQYIDPRYILTSGKALHIRLKQERLRPYMHEAFAARTAKLMGTFREKHYARTRGVTAGELQYRSGTYEYTSCSQERIAIAHYLHQSIKHFQRYTKKLFKEHGINRHAVDGSDIVDTLQDIGQELIDVLLMPARRHRCGIPGPTGLAETATWRCEAKAWRAIAQNLAAHDVFPFGTNGLPKGLAESDVVKCMLDGRLDYYYAWCDACGALEYDYEMSVTEADIYICKDCRDDDYLWSEWQDCYIRNSDAIAYYVRGNVPMDCDSDGWISYDYASASSQFYIGDYEGYSIALDRESYAAFMSYYGEDEDDDDGDDNGIVIGTYHSSRKVFHGIESAMDDEESPVRLGLELEFELADGASISRFDAATRVLDAGRNYNDTVYCLLENDGSLNTGFEMVTNYTGLDVHEQQLQKILTPSVVGNLRSHDTRTCGLHVHISRHKMTHTHILKMMTFIYAPENQNFLDAIARRKSNNYASRGADTAALAKANFEKLVRGQDYSSEAICNHPYYGAKYDWHFNTAQEMVNGKYTHSKTFAQYIKDRGASLYGSIQPTRYMALNLENSRTIEFRLFKGSCKFTTVMATLEFVYALYHYTQQASWTELTAEKFIAWVNDTKQEKFTRYLRPYIVERRAGQAKPVFRKAKAASKEPVPTKKRVVYGRFAPAPLESLAA